MASKWAQLRDDILGDALVLAYRPGPPGKPEQEQGLILVHARDAKLLAQVVERLNQFQKESGELKEVQVRDHAGQKYYQRVERDKSSFYYLRDSLLAFTGQEDMLRKVIERTKKGNSEESFVAGQMRLLGADKQLAALLINPRVFQAEMEHKASTARGQDAVTQKAFLSYWKALDGIALTVALDRDLECAVTIRAKMDQLPAPARRLFAEAAQPSELWNRFPDNALLAAAGRLDLAAFLDLLGEFQTKEDNQALHDSLRNLSAALGKDVVKEVLPHLGPDCGLCITAPAAGQEAWFPQTVALLRLSPGEKGVNGDTLLPCKGQSPSPGSKVSPFTPDERLGPALVSAIQSYALLAVLGYNRQNPDKLTLKTVVHDKTEIKYLANSKLFPPGLEPAFALHDGYLAFASSPEAIRQFGLAVPRKGNLTAGAVPILRISTRDLRKFIKDYREPLTATIAEKNQISKEQAGQQLEKFLFALEPVDRLELLQRSLAGQLTLSLRVRPAQPLK